MIGTPKVDYAQSKADHALSMVRGCSADLELAIYRIDRLERRVHRLVIGFVLLVLLVVLRLWASNAMGSPWPS